jgi:hypothetical protein
MTCAKCGCESPERAKFCVECGAAFAARCASCGIELPPAAKFCLECGVAVAHPSSVAAGFKPASGQVGSEAVEHAGQRPAATGSRSPRSHTPQHLADKILQSKSALEGERK